MKHSAGVLLYRRTTGVLEVLLVHPGGPYWARKDVGAWQIPKGEIGVDEDPATAAVREVEEELGERLEGELLPLGQVRQSGGKLVTAFMLEHDVDADAIVSNEFTMEWPPRSGQMQSFPEVSAARWLTLDEAGRLMLPSQLPLLERVRELAG